MKKIIIIGTIFAALLMLITPCINAVNVQMEEASATEKFEKTVQSLSKLDLRKLAIRAFGILSIGIGCLYYAMALAEPMLFGGLTGMFAVLMAIGSTIAAWLGGDTIIQSFMDGIEGGAGGALYFLACGLFYWRLGFYLLFHGQFPDETAVNSWWFLNFIMKLMDPTAQA